MNLTFGVCWIEDQASDAEVEAVKQAIRNAGFEPEITSVASEPDIKEFARRQNYFQEYELILLDLRLGRGLRGNKLAPDVRRIFRSTPILFYSAEDESKLRKMMAEKLIEGAYCAHRDRLPQRVAELVSNMSPALNRLAGMRGLAARVVAECDFELRKIIKSRATTRELEAELIEQIKTQISTAASKQSEELDGLTTLEELLGSHVASSGVIFNVVKDITSGIGDDGVRTIRGELKKYPHKVIGRRNILAHALEERTEQGWVIRLQDSRNDLTASDFERYRRDFMKHLDAVRRLRELLIPEQV